MYVSMRVYKRLKRQVDLEVEDWSSLSIIYNKPINSRGSTDIAKDIIFQCTNLLVDSKPIFKVFYWLIASSYRIVFFIMQ